MLEDSSGLGARPVVAARGLVKAPTPAAGSPLRVKAGNLPEPWPSALEAIPDAQWVAAPQIQPGAAGKVELVSASGDLISRVTSPPQLRAQMVQQAWAKGLRQLAENYCRGVLPVEVTPALFGCSRRIGENIHFTVRPDRDAWVLLLNISADGLVTAIYPHYMHEVSVLEGGKAHQLPAGGAVVVHEPYGMDYQFAFAFDRKPDGFERWVNALNMAPQDARLAALQRLLPAMAGRYCFAPSELRVLE